MLDLLAFIGIRYAGSNAEVYSFEKDGQWGYSVRDKFSDTPLHTHDPQYPTPDRAMEEGQEFVERVRNSSYTVKLESLAG